MICPSTRCSSKERTARREACRRAGRRDEPDVGDGHDAIVWIAPRAAERVELLQIRLDDAGLREQLAVRGLVERLLLAHAAARQRPPARERPVPCAHQQHVQSSVAHGADGDVDRDGRRRMRAHVTRPARASP